MSALSEFLLARLGEDERHAKAVEHVGIHDSLVMDPVGQVWLERWSPERVLAEVEAKRVIIREAVFEIVRSPASPRAVHLAAYILKTMALAYVAHEDYQTEWRP